jgi:hypothetical protein
LNHLHILRFESRDMLASVGWRFPRIHRRNRTSFTNQGTPNRIGLNGMYKL